MAEPLLGRGSGDGTGDLVLLNKLISGSHEAGGILGSAVHPHFVMQMHARGASGGSHGADRLTEFDPLPEHNHPYFEITNLKILELPYTSEEIVITSLI